MLPDDDTNIGLFPQRINDFYIARFQSLSAEAAADFLIVTGEKGSRLGFIGGTTMQNNFLNLIYGLSSTSAVQVGLRFNSASDKTESGTTSKTKDEIKSNNLGINLVYGTDLGDGKELAIGGSFSSGPYFENANPPWGTKEYSSGSDYKTKAEANVSQFSVGLVLRQPYDMFCFDHLVTDVNFGMATGSGKDTQTSGNQTVTNEEREGSMMNINAGMLMFKNKQLTDKALFVFGAGFGFDYSTQKAEDKLAKLDTTTTGIIVAGPEIRVGLEAEIAKWLKFRFGATNLIDLFYSSKTEYKATSNNTEAKTTNTESGIFKNGQYSFASGFGFKFGNLNIDLQVNEQFWTTGPQMIFNSTWGQMGIRADAVYHFGK